MNRIDISEITERVDELRGEKQDAIDLVSETHDEATAAIAARDELADDDDTQEAVTAAEEAEQAWRDAMDAEREWREENSEELAKLEALLDEIGGYGGDHQWEGTWYPAELIDVESFEEYAEELADDLGAVPSDAGWPLTYIDWKAAAEALAQDYSMVTYDGSDYYYR